MLIAGGMQAVGAIQQGRAQAAQLESQARADDYNAAIQAQQADEVARQASQREDLQRKQARALIGKQVAGTAQAGLKMTGSALDLLNQSYKESEEDALAIRYEGELNRQGLMQQSELTKFQAASNREAAKQTKRASYLSAATSMASAYAYTKMPGMTSGGGGYGIGSGGMGTVNTANYGGARGLSIR
jgi:aminopeptidase N